MSEKELKDEKIAVDTESQADVSFYSDKGYTRAYGLKCDLINKCMSEEIGFGKYQIQLFILTGFGWMADNIWLQGVAIVLGQVQQELLPSRVEFATLALYAGLILGASTWGVLADLIGRRLSFNITLFISGVFGIAAGGAPNFVTFASLVACLGFGLGGNLPVDGALYLENIPEKHQWTLTVLSAWELLLSRDSTRWSMLQIREHGLEIHLVFTGAMTFLMFVMRFVVFDLQESAKYLVAKGRDEEAIQVLQHIAKKNGKTISLTLEQLEAIEGHGEFVPKTTLEVIRGAFSTFSLSHVKPLFGSRKLALNSTLIILCWGLIGLAYPLFNGFLPLYLKQRVVSDGSSSSVNVAYRNYAIIAIMGIPGSIIACLVVDWTRGGQGKWSVGGRKLAMAVSTALTGIFLFLFTTSKSNAAVLGWSCASGVTQNAVFPAPHRGTGDAIASSFNRILGILAPVVKIVTTTASGSANPGVSPNGTVTREGAKTNHPNSCLQRGRCIVPKVRRKWKTSEIFRGITLLCIFSSSKLLVVCHLLRIATMFTVVDDVNFVVSGLASFAASVGRTIARDAAGPSSTSDAAEKTVNREAKDDSAATAALKEVVEELKPQEDLTQSPSLKRKRTHDEEDEDALANLQLIYPPKKRSRTPSSESDSQDVRIDLDLMPSLSCPEAPQVPSEVVSAAVAPVAEAVEETTTTPESSSTEDAQAAAATTSSLHATPEIPHRVLEKRPETPPNVEAPSPSTPTFD
ncbi:hypothetical protein H0H92_000588 [Tricholoma furcatifolium]|nr:hypothetical protein H0H92_000588 [Tricholoma furcatifolium]